MTRRTSSTWQKSGDCTVHNTQDLLLILMSVYMSLATRTSTLSGDVNCWSCKWHRINQSVEYVHRYMYDTFPRQLEIKDFNVMIILLIIMINHWQVWDWHPALLDWYLVSFLLNVARLNTNHQLTFVRLQDYQLSRGRAFSLPGSMLAANTLIFRAINWILSSHVSAQVCLVFLQMVITCRRAFSCSFTCLIAPSLQFLYITCTLQQCKAVIERRLLQDSLPLLVAA